MFTSTHCFDQIAPARPSFLAAIALDIVVFAAPLTNCCVAAALAIINLGPRCLDFMFPPFGWRPWYDGGHHGSWALVLVFSRIVLFASTWLEQSYQFLHVKGSHFHL